MRVRVVVAGTVGALATAVAALVVTAPGLLSIEPLVASLARLDLPVVLAAGSLLLGGAGLLFGWATGDGEGGSVTAYDDRVARRPEAVTADEERLVGADLQATVDAAVEGDETAMAQLTDRLRGAAVAAYAIEAGTDRATARRAVTTGRWTDDPLAEATLGPDTAYPLGSRLRLWLDPDSERERRLRRTIAAVAALGGDR